MTPPAQRRAWLLPLLAFATAAALVAGLAPQLLRSPAVVERERSRERGTGPTVPALLELRALCVDPNGDGEVRELDDGDACPRGSVLGLTYSSYAERNRYGRIVAVDAEGRRHQLAPAEPDGRAQAIDIGGVDVRIGRLLPIDATVPLGELQVFGLFADTVPTLDDHDAAFDAFAAGTAPPAELTSVRLEIRITPGLI